MYSNINRRQYLKDLATVAVGFSIAGPLMSMQQPQKGKTIQVIYILSPTEVLLSKEGFILLKK